MKVFLQRILQEVMKKIILGTSDAWWTIRLSHRPSDPAYYIVNWRISTTNDACYAAIHYQKNTECKSKLTHNGLEPFLKDNFNLHNTFQTHTYMHKLILKDKNWWYFSLKKWCFQFNLLWQIMVEILIFSSTYKDYIIPSVYF